MPTPNSFEFIHVDDPASGRRVRQYVTLEYRKRKRLQDVQNHQRCLAYGEVDLSGQTPLPWRSRATEYTSGDVEAEGASNPEFGHPKTELALGSNLQEPAARSEGGRQCRPRRSCLINLKDESKIGSEVIRQSFSEAQPQLLGACRVDPFSAYPITMGKAARESLDQCQ